MLPGMNSCGILATRSATATGSYVTSTLDETATNVFTFTNHNTGTAGNRHTIVGVTGTDGTTAFTIDSVTVGGVAATSLVTNAADTGSLVQCGLYIIDNPSGTTATIVVTFSEAIIGCSVSVWAGYGLNSATAVDTASQFQTSSANIVLSLDVPTDGFAVGVSAYAGAAQTPTWAGFTERIHGNGTSMDYGAADTATVGTPLTVGCDWTSTGDSAGVSASFR